MGSKEVQGPSLFDKFESALHQMGILIEFGDDGSTGLNETTQKERSVVDSTVSQTGDENHYPVTNGTPITPRRRASFNTTLDIGEDATQKSFAERPSSRASLSRLETGKPDFSKLKLSPKPKTHEHRPKSPDRTQLIAQFLDVGRRLISRFDSVQHRNKAEEQEKPHLTNGVVARSAVHQDRSKRMVAAAKNRRSPSISSSDSFESSESHSEVSQATGHDSIGKENVPPEMLYRPQLSDLLRDASTFNMYRQRANCRRILTQWLKRAFHARQIRETRESVAINRDRSTLLRQAFEPWRAIIQDKRHTARTERFFKHLDERASRARDLYLMTKAFTHWAQLTSEEVARTSAARRHVLSVKYFNAWREITAVNELKAQRFALQKPFNKWRKKAADLKAAEAKAVTIHKDNLRHASYWQWFWGFCDRRAPEWYDSQLKRRSLLYWLRYFRTNREREQEIAIHNRKSSLASVLHAWSQKSKTITSAEQKAAGSQRYRAIKETFDEWKIQAKLAPAASQVTDMVDGRILRTALSKWIEKARLAEQAVEMDRIRVERNAWVSWNDTLRCLALQARINERLKMETMYKWILMERFQLMRRIREQRIKREVFSLFVTNTRDTYTQLLSNAEVHEGHWAKELVRSKLAVWRDQLLLQREREYTAFEFYAPRLAQESLMAWRSKHEQIVKMESWARDAEFYFLMKRSLKNWRQATLDSAKRRRKDAYSKMRRKVKVNMAAKALAMWASKTQAITNMEQQAAGLDRQKLMSDVADIFSGWHGQTLKRVQDYQEADLHYFRQIAFDQLIQLSETYVIRREMEDQADSVYRRHVLFHAGASLRKLSLRIFQMRSTVETAEAMRERTLRKHSRNLFRLWVETARLKLEARDSPGPALTSTQYSRFGEVERPGSALFDPWYQDTSETPFKMTDFTTNSMEPVSASPLATPSYMTSPSKRAARARALAQMSTTPATPLHTPFASRLLRAEASASRTTSSRRPQTGRRSLTGTSVRFVDEELPESPTDGRKSANRRP
jgi:protein SFI1